MGNRSALCRGALAAALACGIGVAGATPATAEYAPPPDVLTCHVLWNFYTFGELTADGDSFSGRNQGDCYRQQVKDSGGATGLWMTIEGTWESAACGTGVLRGQITFDLNLGGHTTVDFEVLTAAGGGAAVVTASDSDGKPGTGVLAVAETVTAQACAPASLPVIDGLLTVSFGS